MSFWSGLADLLLGSPTKKPRTKTDVFSPYLQKAGTEPLPFTGASASGSAKTSSKSSYAAGPAPGSDEALLNLLKNSGLYNTQQFAQQDWIQHHPLAAAFAQQHGINLLNQSASPGQVDPLSQQLFFFSTVAPYLDQIRQQTQSMTAPLYAQIQQQLGKLPKQYQALSPMLGAMQAGEQDLQSSLAASAAVSPSLDQLMANVSAERQAQQKAYYEAMLARTAGTSGTAGNPFGLTLPST